MTIEGDVLLFNTNNGGNVKFIAGQPEMTAGFDTMIFLCLFGGNFLDNGLSENRKTWWGNLNIEDPDNRYISRMQNLVGQIALNSGNLRRIEEAAKADLEVFKTSGIANSVLVFASIPARNRLNLLINIDSPRGENSQVEFLINWQSYTVQFKTAA